jgi:hypothetical protein
MQYEERVPYGVIVTLRAAINDSTNSVNNIEWEQIDDPNSEIHLGNTVFMANPEGPAYVDVDTSHWPSSYRLPILIQVFVTNSYSTISASYQLWIDQPPIAGTFNLNPTAGTSLVTNFTAYFNNWEIDPSERALYPLTYRIEYQLNNEYYIILPPTQINFTSTNQYNISSIFFPLINAYSQTTIKVYLTATSYYGLENSTVFNLRLNPPPQITGTDETSVMNGYYYILQTLSNATSWYSALYNVLNVNQMFEQYNYENPLSFNCYNDIHCSGHGTCNGEGSWAMCDCMYGYVGTNCQFPEIIFQPMISVMTNALEWVANKTSNLATNS